MRALVLLIIGIVVGALCGMSAARQVASARAYPRGVMAVLQHHLSASKAQLLKPAQCEPAQVRRHLLSMARIMPEVLPALTRPAATADPRQSALGQSLGQAIEQALALPPLAVCTTLVQPVSAIAQACTDCHREYR